MDIVIIDSEIILLAPEIITPSFVLSHTLSLGRFYFWALFSTEKRLKLLRKSSAFLSPHYAHIVGQVLYCW